MKDSGVAWIGEIPQEWEITRGKNLFRISKRVVGNQSDHFTLLSLTKQGLIKRDMENPQGKFPAEFDSYQVVKPGNFVFCLFDVEETPRTVELSTLHGMITGAYTVMECLRPQSSKYLYYQFLSFDDDKKLRPLYTGMRNTIPKEVFMGIRIAFPPLPEQIAIADYLDRQTVLIDQRLDTLAEKKTVLAELRKAIIHEAVTKGLNKTSPMKNSGVAWVGEIPQEWELMTFKSVVKFREGPGIMASDFKDTGVPLLRIGNITQGLVTLEGCNYLDPEKVQRQWRQFKVRLGELIISASASVGIVSEVSLEAVGAIPYTGLITLRPSSHVFKNYLRYFVISQLFVDQIADFQKGATIQHYGPTHLKQMLIPLPPIDEQKAIADYLDRQTAQIDAQIATLDEQMQVLKELRKSIIHEAVTGKIALSSYTPPTPEALIA